MNVAENDSLELALRLLNERLPLLIEAGGETVRERVAFARTAPATDAAALEIVTYRGRRLHFAGVRGVAIDVTERDAQGVPVAYTLTLDAPGGAQQLTLVA